MSTRHASAIVLAMACSMVSWPVAQVPARLAFDNVSATSSLTFVLDQHPTADRHMVETMAGGLAVFDYDSDGLPDVFFTNGASLPSLQGVARRVEPVVSQPRRASVSRRHRRAR